MTNFKMKSMAFGLSFKQLLSSSVLAAALCAFTAPAAAQSIDEASSAQANPAESQALTVFGENNPNIRRATAIVNGKVITGTDIDQRMALLLAANDGTLAAEETKALRLQVLRNLIDETLQIQAAKANEIEVKQAEINQTYTRVANESFRQDPSAMDAYLTRIGSSPASLRQQIHGELAWQRLLGRNVTPFVNVAEEEVKDIMKRLEESKGVEEYRIGEIYLSATQENAQQVFENASRLIQQIQQGANFTGYARQFSEASTAPVGGDLGYVRLETLPAEMATAARQMQIGQLVGPVQIPGGFVIVYLIDKRQILTADPRDALLSLKQLSISFPPGVTQEQAAARAGEFANAARQIRGCGDANRVAAGLGASVVDNDQVTVRSLPSALQDTVLQMSIGESTPPFGSIEQGIRILVLCGRDDPKVNSGPTAEQLTRQLEDERINKRAQTYLRDLRRDAVISYN
ncbi:peptidylprolyl isomerase [Sphingorhabdus sp. Alg239-R122]|uniref:peptidylprolyl isomerase n=1 Tax=Sphingorhabdus sp. Alg239-R122 TaxID=2305989 RepID=UPI001F07CA2C|nr:peptidylprolyl isomerase [Sphingorhabdus sp. Alg239-R122]